MCRLYWLSVRPCDGHGLGLRAQRVNERVEEAGAAVRKRKERELRIRRHRGYALSSSWATSREEGSVEGVDHAHDG